MSADEDSFDDDDDFDIDQLYEKAQFTQQWRKQALGVSNDLAEHSNSINKAITKEGITTGNNTTTSNLDIYEIKGENAVLKDKIAKLQREQLEQQHLIKQEFNKLLTEKEDHIAALNESLSKTKSENEFLVSENKNLYQSNSRKRKMKIVETSEPETSTQNTTNQNISMSTQNTTILDVTNNITGTQSDPKPEIKVIVMNQATFFQDEKTLFIESITHYIIPGMKKPAFNYLENILSTFNYTHEDFQIIKFETSFKSAILEYLINFQDKNRIDNLLSKFINILLQYLVESLNQEVKHLLPIPYLISLVNFSLNYKPKAINETFIGETTKLIISLLSNFQELLKPEFKYLSIPGSDQIFNFETLQSKENNEILNYSFIEKTMHFKILEVFTTTYLIDTLSTLGKISAFHVFTFSNSQANSNFWKAIPQQLLINSLLSKGTPVHFIYNVIDILINSINDDDRFAFANVRINSITKPKVANDITVKILEQTMQVLTNLSPKQIQFNIYGLNNCIGSNNHLELLEMISISSGESNSYPNTNSFDSYSKVLENNTKYFQSQENFILQTKLNILNLFELFYSSLLMILLPLNTHLKLIKILCQLIGEEQEILIRSPRSSNNGLKIEIISKCVKILHYLIAQEGLVKIHEISNLTLREMIIVLLRISSISMKNYSINFINDLRKNLKFKEFLFNGTQEMNELDKFGLWNSILSSNELDKVEREKLIKDRIQIEVDLYNGIEFNYSDETIDIARDIVSLSVTGDEADRLHDSINYINDLKLADDEDNDFDYDMQDFI